MKSDLAADVHAMAPLGNYSVVGMGCKSWMRDLKLEWHGRLRRLDKVKEPECLLLHLLPDAMLLES